MISNIEQKAALIYRARRLANDEKAIKLAESVYRKHPKLADLDHKIAGENIRIALDIMKDGIMRASSKQKEQYLKDRNQYIKEHRIPAQFDEPVYDCPRCKDTGVLADRNNEKCDCYKQTIVPILFENSNLKNISDCRFDRFKLSLFNDKSSVELYGSDISPRQQMKGTYAVAMKYVRDFDFPGTKNLFFIGKPGTGKTYLSACIANELIQLGYFALYLSASELFEYLSVYRVLSNSFSPNPERFEKIQMIHDSILHCDLLIIDDFGTESGTANRQPDLLSILNYRLDAGRKMIISTNLDIKNIFDLYDERVLSRITGNFSILKLFGEDLRHISR